LGASVSAGNGAWLTEFSAVLGPVVSPISPTQTWKYHSILLSLRYYVLMHALFKKKLNRTEFSQQFSCVKPVKLSVARSLSK